MAARKYSTTDKGEVQHLVRQLCEATKELAFWELRAEDAEEELNTFLDACEEEAEMGYPSEQKPRRKR